jgi:DNA-binding NarL/FixJ family response regulator
MPTAASTADGDGMAFSAESLTGRTDQQIAELVADGLSNRQIADQLVISRRTVDAHVEHIVSKLDIPSRTMIVMQRSVPEPKMS